MRKKDEYPKIGNVVTCPECGAAIAKRTAWFTYEIAQKHGGDRLQAVAVTHGSGMVSFSCPRGCDYRYHTAGVIEEVGISEEIVRE